MSSIKYFLYLLYLNIKHIRYLPLLYTNLFLKRRSIPVSITSSSERSNFLDFLHDVLPVMIKFMKDNDGLAVAANQVGIRQSIVVFDKKLCGFDRSNYEYQGRKYLVVVNPSYVSKGPAKESAYEGCLSCPGVYYNVYRFKHISATYTDPFTWRKYQTDLSYFVARVFQHECDHLNGITIADQYQLKNNKQLARR